MPLTISTHTPHARRDDFIESVTVAITIFLLTRLMRGVTIRTVQFTVPARISTHTPHARRDDINSIFAFSHCVFLLTRLMRGVTLKNILFGR